MTRGWATAVCAIVLAGAAFGVGYAVSDDGHGSNDDHGLRGDRMATMMADGTMPAQMGDFIEMMNELGAQMTPEMRSRMDDDPMWQLMESGELEEMMDSHDPRLKEVADRVLWLEDGTFKDLACMTTDPVCDMAVAQQDGPHFQFDGTTWWFCSSSCRDEFAGDPQRFAERARANA